MIPVAPPPPVLGCVLQKREKNRGGEKNREKWKTGKNPLSDVTKCCFSLLLLSFLSFLSPLGLPLQVITPLSSLFLPVPPGLSGSTTLINLRFFFEDFFVVGGTRNSQDHPSPMIEPTTDIVAVVVPEPPEAALTPEQRLWNACLVHATRDVGLLLREHPDVDVNWGHPGSFLNTPLHLCSSDENADIIRQLLAHPQIDVNRKNMGGWSPLLWACKDGRLGSVVALLLDRRVDVNSANIEGATAVWLCAFRGWADIARWLVVTHFEDLDVGIKTNGSHLAFPNTSSVEISQRDDERHFWDSDSAWWHRIKGRGDVQSLLLRFCHDRRLAAFEARLDLGMRGKHCNDCRLFAASHSLNCDSDAGVAKVFSLAVLLSDGYLRPRVPPWGGRGVHASAATKFYAIVERLPIELQMVICHLAVSSNRVVVLGSDSDLGFKHCLRLYAEEDEEIKSKREFFGCVVS